MRKDAKSLPKVKKVQESVPTHEKECQKMSNSDKT